MKNEKRSMWDRFKQFFRRSKGEPGQDAVQTQEEEPAYAGEPENADSFPDAFGPQEPPVYAGEPEGADVPREAFQPYPAPLEAAVALGERPEEQSGVPCEESQPQPEPEAEYPGGFQAAIPPAWEAPTAEPPAPPEYYYGAPQPSPRGVFGRVAALSPGGKVCAALLALIAALICVLLLKALVYTPLMAHYNAAQGDRLAENLQVYDRGDFVKSGSFYLDGVKGLSQSYLEENLNISPKTQFTVYKESSTRAVVRIQDHKNILYTVSITDPFVEKRHVFFVNNNPLTLKFVNVDTMSYDYAVPIAIQFSDPVAASKLKSNITVSPSLSFDVETDDNLAYIIFTEEPRSGTSYTLTVSNKLESKNSQRLYQDETLTFRTKKAPVPDDYPASPPPKANSGTVSLTNGQAEIIKPSSPIVMEFETSDRWGYDDVPVVISTYAFDSLDKYISQAVMLTRYTGVDLSSILTKADTGVRTINAGLNTLQLENPGSGAYILEAVVKHPSTEQDIRMRKIVFVTDLSVYIQSTGADVLLWANDGSDSSPLAGYTVEFYKNAFAEAFLTATTDGDGVAVTDRGHPEYDYYSGADIVKIRDPSGRCVYADNTRVLNSYYGWKSEKYYSYFYTDRALYKPTDTVSFWGYVKPYAFNDSPAPEYVDVVFDEDGLNMTVRAAVDAYGTFYGEIPLEQIKSSQYYLCVYLPGETRINEETGEETVSRYMLDSAWLDVKEYQKPTFVLSSETDKDIYNYDEHVTVYATPQFYDGTPLPNYELECSIYTSYYGEKGLTRKIVTDETGVAKFSFPAFQETKSTIPWMPVANRYEVRLVQDGENITHTGTYTYLPSDTMLVSSVTVQNNGNFRLELQTNRIAAANLDENQTERLKSLYYNPDDFDYYREQYNILRGAAVDTEVRLKITYEYYTANGADMYDYVYEEEKELTVHTAGGTYTLSDLIDDPHYDSRFYAYIQVEAYTEDSLARTVRYGNSASNYRYRYVSSDEEDSKPRYKGYAFDVTNRDGEDLLGEYAEYLTYNQASAGDGEAMSFALTRDGQPIDNNGRILYTVIQNGIIRRGITSERALALTQNVNFANSINVAAAYFDGREVHAIRNTVVTFEKESARLTVEVTPDQASYRPGDNVTLSVRVTDQNGNGVQGNTCVSVVDESIFALKEQYVDVLGTLYGGMDFDNYNIPRYTTAEGDINAEYGWDAGKGDAENLDFYDSYRSNFKDTAHFAPIRTNSAGYGTVSFRLPDNTTSWRVTALSVGDNLYGGNSKSNFISSLPFFVKPVVTGKYITGDEVVMLIQGHGTLLESDTEIDYSVTIEGDGYGKTMTAKNTAFNPVELNFGVLPEGEYVIKSTASFSGYSDTVEQTFAVIGSNLELVIHRPVDLTAETPDVNALRYPVVISFYDKEYAAYYESISSLLTHYCMQTGQRMSRFVAKRALGEHMDPEDIPQHIRSSGPGNDSASDIQNEDGGIGYYSGDTSNPVLTAKILIAAKDQFNLNLMAEYFNDTILYSGNTLEKAASYMGLAVIGEPVTEKVVSLIEDERTGDHERAYLIAALAYSDPDGGMDMYRRYITPHLVHSGMESFIRMDGYDKVQNDQITAAAWIAASKLGLEEADGISIYFAKTSWRIDTLFECMIYVTNYDKSKMVGAGSFSYESNGQTHTVSLGAQGQRSISFTKSELESLRFIDVPESLRATAYYIGEPSEVDIQPSEKVSMEKRIVRLDNGRYQVYLLMKFTGDAPAGYYDISEWIPSNMRLYSVNTNYRIGARKWNYSYSDEGQKLYFKYDRRSSDKTAVITYTLQKTFDAEVIADSAYIIHGDTGENNFSERKPLSEMLGSEP